MTLMQLRCGGIFSDHLLQIFTQNVPVKKFGKSVNQSIFGNDMEKSLQLALFGPPCTLSQHYHNKQRILSTSYNRQGTIK